MRTITVYSGHIYTTKSSAWRAARNAVGTSYEVTEAEFRSNFEGEITIRAEMLSAEACEGGWHWAYTYNLADVETWVIRDGKKIGCRYADAADWKDCHTPPSETQNTPVQEVARRIAEYHREINNASGPLSQEILDLALTSQTRIKAADSQAGGGNMKTHLRQSDNNIWPVCPSNRSDGRLCCAVKFSEFIHLPEEEKCKRCAKIAENRIARKMRNQPH